MISAVGGLQLSKLYVEVDHYAQRMVRMAMDNFADDVVIKDLPYRKFAYRLREKSFVDWLIGNLFSRCYSHRSGYFHGVWGSLSIGNGTLGIYHS